MSRRYAVLVRFLTVLTDMVMASWAFYLAYELRTRIPIPTPLRLAPFWSYSPQLVIQTLSVLVTFFLYRLYHPRQNRSRVDLFYTILSATSIAAVVSTAASFLTVQSSSDLTRGLVIYTWALTVLMIPAGRALVSLLEGWTRRRHPQKVLLVGTGDVAHMILHKTSQARLGYKVIGFIAEQKNGDIAGVPVLGGQSDLARLVQEHAVDEVIIALPQASHEELLDMISVCESARAAVRIFPDLFQIIASEVSISDLDGLPMLTVRDVALRGWKLAVKRVMDIVVSGLGLIALSPFMMLVALLIKLESKGPVFYAQVRVGLDGKPFHMIKLRSMRTDAEQSSGPVWATADDPRKTRLGSLLRATSIDELPQLINVLAGDMSLVGPRPERPVFVEQFKQVVPRYMERHKEKAGMTGWAQVNGLRGDTSIIERTKYDLYYIENWSLLFDLKIILRTIINVFRRDRNAY
jgi:exopolysaccharide biosynthesis polyprenyl glycosylphosphotransferase